MQSCAICTYDNVTQYGKLNYCPCCLAVVDIIEQQDDEDLEELPH